MKKLGALAAVSAAAAIAQSAYCANRTLVDAESGMVTVIFDEPGEYSWTAPSDRTVELLVVGGGGEGGYGEAGGGGGGGEVFHSAAYAVVAGRRYRLAVGAGGTGAGNRMPGVSGGASRFGDVICPGGGGGGGTNGKRGGLDGANSGGACASFRSGYSFPAATGRVDTAGGWYGGHAGGARQGSEASGGGGGATGPGGTGTSGTAESPGRAGNGGDGYPCDITGALVYYGTGGGGGARGESKSPYTAMIVAGGSGGSGGASGGNGAAGNGDTGEAGRPATGAGGGGGGWNATSARAGGAGGGGIVALRYRISTPVVGLETVDGFAGAENAAGVSVSVFYPSDAVVLYASSAEGPWSPACPEGTIGVNTVWVKVSADGLDDFAGTASYTLKDPSAENDGNFIFVAPDGSGAAPYSTWSSAAGDLQTAVDYAARVKPSATILVADGVYRLESPLALTNASGRICSLDPSTGATVCGGAVFDAGGMFRVATIDSMAVRGCAFVNGFVAEESGGGVRVSGNDDAERPLLERCLFSNNVVRCVQAADALRGGGGLYIASGIGKVTVAACEWVDNVATGAADTVAIQGGGVLSSTPCSFTACRFLRNTASGNKGGGYGPQGGALRGGDTTYVDGCSFISNRCFKLSGSTAYGGAVSLRAQSVVRNSSFMRNDCERGVLSGAQLVSNCVFTANGFHNGDSLGSTVVACVFRENEGNILNCTTLKMRNCLFAGNGTVYWAQETDNSRVDFENCTFTGNARVFDVYNSNRVNRHGCFVNCLFSGNGDDIAASGSTLETIAGAYAVFATNCCWSAAESARFVTAPVGCFALPTSPFVDAAGGDFRLKPSSRCRDGGIVLGWMEGAGDLAGLPRRLDESGRPAVDALPDIGCYECDMRAPGFLMLLK